MKSAPEHSNPAASSNPGGVTAAEPPKTDLPRISFIMPTLNAEALLDNVLGSITRQTYPREQMEIILADAHSKDRTR